MSRKERTRREWENRRNDIIDAAESLFFSRGYERTTMDDIVRRAEFSKSTLYKYIKSKEELFLLVHMRGLVKRKSLIKAMERETDGSRKLRQFGRGYYEFYKKYPEYLRLQLYWSVNGINFEKISQDVIDEFRIENEKALLKVREAFESILVSKGKNCTWNLDRLVSYYLHTLRIVLNQSIFPVDPFGRWNSPEYYFEYLDLFMRAIDTIQREDSPGGPQDR